MSEKQVKKQGFLGRLISESPVFSMYLGLCSTLAISTSLNNALGMGIGVIFVLVLSNMLVSMVRHITPDDIHIPVYITIIATLVTVLSMLMHAFTPTLFTALGAFLDLITVNCIILGRAEAFSCKNNVVDSVKDGFQMGLAYTGALLCMAVIRQIVGTGILSLSNPFTDQLIFKVQLIPIGFEIPLFTEQFGAFITFACIAALVANYKNRLATQGKRGK